MAIRLVLADDHPLILDGIEQLVRLAGDLTVLERCVTGEEALRAVEEHRPDVLVLDLRMPVMDGFEVLREMRRRRLPTRVVILTAALSEREMLDVIRLGVYGVVLKEMAPRLLVQCLRKVHAGEQWIEKRSLLDAMEAMMRREAGAREAASELTPREIQLIRMVAEGLRNKEIAEQLSISEGTVKVHLHNVYKKLRVDNRVSVRRYAEEKGLI
jgi:two-component system, NarL family, nitrate/nitrite response regulator NarL